MKDLRSKKNVSVRGKYITAGYKINESDIEDIFDFLKVEYNDDLIKEVIGFLSMNSMEISINNVQGYLDSIKK